MDFMSEEIQIQIKELEWELNRLINAAKRLNIIEIEIKSLNYKVGVKARQVDRELADVQKLEKMGLYRLFAKILKDKESQIEKERQEYLMVVLEYQSLSKELNLLIYEQNILKEKLQRKDEVKEKLLGLLKQKELYLLKDLGLLLPKVVSLNKEIDKLNNTLFDIKDSSLLCALCIENLNNLSEKINQVRIWGFPDQFGNPTRLSYKSIQITNEAPEMIAQLKNRLTNLNNELKDLDPELHIKSDFIEFENFVNNYQKIMLDEWLSQSKLSKIKANLLTLENLLNHLFKSLNNKKLSISEKIDNMEEEKMSLLAVI